MARFTGFDEVFSALYVDFDNIYTRFLEIDPEAARAFGSVPYRWVRWIENHALRILYGEGVRRRILKRMCYLNPQRYQEYRNPFIRSAFQVVDCPPLTTRGKTSTDIHLVMDCMDDLSHSTHFDEFIILSGDADFDPPAHPLAGTCPPHLGAFCGLFFTRVHGCGILAHPRRLVFAAGPARRARR